jgi:hypothetical protein
MSNAPQTSDTDRLALTSAEFAKQLGISQRHLHTITQAGLISAPSH